MYELVSVIFPFADDIDKGKPRPSFVISPPFGKYNQVVVTYVTTQLDEILETDILLDTKNPYFASTGLIQKSLIKLHRLATVEPSALKEGQGFLPDALVEELQKKLLKVFYLK